MASTNDLKNGLVLNLEGQLWSVVEFQHVKPGKGPAFVRTKNVLSGKVVDKTFNAGVKVETANVDRSDMQYLYKDGDDFVFMDTKDYDQIHIPAATVGSAADYLLENQEAIVATHDGTVLYVELPTSVVLEISHTEPGLQGDRSSGGTKPATLETGAEIQVPLFLETGTKVKVDTRDGSYLGRVQLMPEHRPEDGPKGTGAAPGKGARAKARKRALDLLFEAEQRGVNVVALLDERVATPVTQTPLPSYTGDLVRGVVGQWHPINEALETYSTGWPLERMPAVDRGLLRLATWEILYNDDVPDRVAIAEAVALATELSTDESPKFINGLLARIAEVKPTLA